MVKKRKREHVSTDAKDQISQKLAEFNASTDKEYTFEANLTKGERKVVHNFCLKYGMKSKSTGNKDRCVTVRKKEKQAATVDSTPQKKVLAITKMNRPQRAPLNRRCQRGPQNRRRQRAPQNQRAKQEKDYENLTHLTFSEEGKAALQNLFMYYPPHEEEMEKKMLEDHSKKTVKRRHTRNDILQAIIVKGRNCKEVERT